MNLKKVVSASLVACAVMALTPPAHAATGTFPWSVSMTHQVDSRNWTATKGSQTISSNLACWGNPAVTTYKIQLHKNNTLADTDYTKATFTCGKDQMYTWTGLPAGTFHFSITKATDGLTAKGTGRVTYPSN